MRSILPLFLSLTLVVLFTACGNTKEGTSQAGTTTQAKLDQTPTYPTMTVVLTDLNRPVRLTGRVVPLQQSVISSQVPGKVLPTNKLLQEGKYYRGGETIIRIDDEQLRYRLKADRANFKAALVRILSDMSLDYPAEYSRWESFADAIQVDQLLPAMPPIEEKKLDYFISAKGIPGQYYAIKAQEATLDDYTISAPFSGQLTAASVEPGAIVQPGQQLATISRTDTYELKASLPASAVEKLKIGQAIRLFASNINQYYEGKVNRFSSVLDQRTQTVTVFVRLSGPQLREGLYLQGELPGEVYPEVMALPKEALTRDGNVHLILDSMVVLQAVEPVLIEADKVYVRGLSNGDRVITEATQKPIVGTRAR
ncbi:MAG: efflux RND transporter periplasmic adaptor subunit [Bacteroidota bacterium]